MIDRPENDNLKFHDLRVKIKDIIRQRHGRSKVYTDIRPETPDGEPLIYAEIKVNKGVYYSGKGDTVYAAFADMLKNMKGQSDE